MKLLLIDVGYGLKADPESGLKWHEEVFASRLDIEGIVDGIFSYEAWIASDSEVNIIKMDVKGMCEVEDMADALLEELGIELIEELIYV